MFHQLPSLPPEHSRYIDPNDPAIAEYMRTRPDARMVVGPDGQVVAIEDILPHPPPGQEARPVQPPHGIPLVYGFKHDSGPGYDPERQLPPMPPMIPVIPANAEGSRDVPPPINDHHGGTYLSAHAHGHVHPQSHSHGGSSHHSRSNSTRPDLDSLNPRIEVAQGPSIHGRSPPMAGAEAHNDRTRRHDFHELTHAHGHPLPHPHVQIPVQNMPTSPHSHSPTSTRGSDRSSGRIHNHQRVGPGANIHRERDLSKEELEQIEYARELERQEELGRERLLVYRQRLEAEELEEEARLAYMRDNGRVAPATGHGDSRSGSPTSGPGNGGSRVPSRPDSGQSVQYDAERARPRMSNLLGIEREPAYDERASRAAARSNAGDIPAPSAEARRRYRGEMDANEEYGSEIRSPGEAARVPSAQGGTFPDGGAAKGRSSADATNVNGSEAADDRMDEGP